jgi:hypothetical protein
MITALKWNISLASISEEITTSDNVFDRNKPRYPSQENVLEYLLNKFVAPVGTKKCP